MPGDSLKMHIVFKSNIGGIFTEKWEFVTHPRLLSAASLVLTLRGVAVQEDKFKKNRILIEVIQKNSKKTKLNFIILEKTLFKRSGIDSKFNC